MPYSDESGLHVVPDTCRVVACKVKRNVYQVTSAERGVLTTVLLCYNAAGYYVRPMIMYKGNRLTDGLKDMPDSTLIAMSDTGYMNMDLFQTCLENVQKEPAGAKFSSSSDTRWARVPRQSDRRSQVCREKQLSIVCVPPHTTHWTQPLDRCYFRPLKPNYARVVQIYA